ncbi:MAG: zinc-binding dehydrogenase [Fimbriimonadaceae bacterium]|jgi:threonine dehydrogenase-like Zn-dependent dehydrogenase|nr:zinc-binding dehydrogenase [Fimbriimonadaceae bacterium]
MKTQEIPQFFSAGILREPQNLIIDRIPLWPLADYGDDDLVLIEVGACGVCGSDYRYYLGENPWSQHTLGRFVPNPPNIVLGHEYAGVVVKVLHQRNKHLLGKRVAPICSKTCGRCEMCLSGRSRLCPNTVHMGHGQGWGDRDFFPGAYGRYAPAWGSSCFEVPDHVGLDEAAMMDILAVCVHVAHMGDIQPGRPILTIGAGPAGNGVAQAALALGASQAVLLDRSPLALSIADQQKIGITLNTSNMADDEVVEQLRHIAPSGFGTVFDTVGNAASISLGLDVLGKAGTLVNLAVHDEPIPFNFMKLGSERKIVTSCNFEVGDYPLALSWLAAGRFRVKEWLTPVALHSLPSLFHQVTTEKEKSVFKLVIDPTLEPTR